MTRMRKTLTESHPICWQKKNDSFIQESITDKVRLQLPCRGRRHVVSVGFSRRFSSRKVPSMGLSANINAKLSVTLSFFVTLFKNFRKYCCRHNVTISLTITGVEPSSCDLVRNRNSDLDTLIFLSCLLTNGSGGFE